MEALLLMGMFIGIPWVLGSIVRTYLSHQRFMKVLQLKTEMNYRLMDKLGADASMLEFLRSDAQQQMFDVKLADPSSGPPVPYGRVLTAIQASLMLLAAGGGFLYMHHHLPTEYYERGMRGMREAFLLFGTLGIALGIGALLSAFAAVIVAKVWRNGDQAPASR